MTLFGRCGEGSQNGQWPLVCGAQLHPLGGHWPRPRFIDFIIVQCM